MLLVILVVLLMLLAIGMVDIVIASVMLLAIGMVDIIVASVMRFICAPQKNSFSTVVKIENYCLLRVVCTSMHAV